MKSKMPRIIIPILTKVAVVVVDIAIVSVLVVVKVGGKVVVLGLVVNIAGKFVAVVVVHVYSLHMQVSVSGEFGGR